MLAFTFSVGLFVLASAGNVARYNSALETTATKHKLRVCNAYPSAHDLRVLKNSKELEGKSQMKYKECTELEGSLNEGDRLNFEADAVPLGTFTVSELPKEQSTLLLVAFRESKSSTKIMFTSHVFRAGDHAQLAVIDTFQGKTKTELSMSQFQEATEKGAAPAVEEEAMKFGTVMTLKAGVYQVKIATGVTAQVAGPFPVANGENYVVLRTGLDDSPARSPSFLQMAQESDTVGPWMLQQPEAKATFGNSVSGDSHAVGLMAMHARVHQEWNEAPTGGDFLESDSKTVNLLEEHAGKNGQERLPASMEMHHDTSGTNFLAEADSVNLMAEYAGKDRQGTQAEHFAATTGTNFFADAESVRLLSEHAGRQSLSEAGGSTGTAMKLVPGFEAPPADNAGGLTDPAPKVMKQGETLEQFLGLEADNRYPPEFVVYPLLKPVATAKERSAKEEHSGASAAGSLAASAMAVFIATML